MPLPILGDKREPTEQDLLRLFHRTELHWARHLGEEAQLDVGTAFTNAELSRVWDANRMMDAVLPEGVTPPEAVAQVEEHFAAQGTRCAKWSMNLAARVERLEPLTEHLLSLGHWVYTAEVFHLVGMPKQPVRDAVGLTVIPARASFRHARQLAEEDAAEKKHGPQLVQASLMHLDDPHWDAILAMQDGKAVGMLGVLAVGEIGRIDEVFVNPAYRRRGIGRALMGRALEICARSQFRHVLLCTVKGNHIAQALYTSIGFRKIGELQEYVAPEN